MLTGRVLHETQRARHAASRPGTPGLESIAFARIYFALVPRNPAELTNNLQGGPAQRFNGAWQYC
jgi:hypothetical protein